MYKKISLILILILGTTIFYGCSQKEELGIEDNKINVVTTIFPPYDFVREIGGENVNVKMLLKPGEESHSYEPTPKDIIDIQNSDLFIYVGGENDVWVNDILESMGDDRPQTLKLIDTVKTVEEEIVEGMEHEHNEDDDHNHDEDKHTIDEHVWTSPKNSILIVEEISDILGEKDEKNLEVYKKNSSEYIKKLEDLDNKFKEKNNIVWR